jgi:cell division protein ZapE
MTGTTAAAPSAAYAAGVARRDWSFDPAQQPALAELDRLHATLLEPPRRGLFDALLSKPVQTPRGLYLWGGVGRGKTFLIDLFFDGLPFAQKRRTHFHRFMREVHAQLRAHAGERDPLAAIARAWRQQWRVLVLDEFFVIDIGDAMLLGRLLDRLFAEGVALVTSSNIDPLNLYQDGLQRERFLPAIKLLQEHCAVVHLAGATDYRLRALTRSPVYRAPLDAQSDAWLASRWQELTAGCCDLRTTPHGDRRPRIRVRATAEGHAWFDFGACAKDRARPATTSRSRPSTTRAARRHSAVRRRQRTIRRAASSPGRRAVRPPRQPGLHRRRGRRQLYTGSKLPERSNAPRRG